MTTVIEFPFAFKISAYPNRSLCVDMYEIKEDGSKALYKTLTKDVAMPATRDGSYLDSEVLDKTFATWLKRNHFGELTGNSVRYPGRSYYEFKFNVDELNKYAVT